MSTDTLPAVISNLPMPAMLPARPLQDVLATSAEVWLNVSSVGGHSGTAGIRASIERGERFLALCQAQGGLLGQALEPVPVDDVSRQLMGFVAAWPNASGGDIAGYGSQLIQDVVERKPCRYALREALRQLRHKSKFLPSISEVLTALDTAQTAIRNTWWHITTLPDHLAKAHEALASAERRDAEHAEREAAAVERRAADGKSSFW